MSSGASAVPQPANLITPVRAVCARGPNFTHRQGAPSICKVVRSEPENPLRNAMDGGGAEAVGAVRSDTLELLTRFLRTWEKKWVVLEQNALKFYRPAKPGEELGKLLFELPCDKIMVRTLSTLCATTSHGGGRQYTAVLFE